MAHGLDGGRAAAFATFRAPPLEVFEIGILFQPLETRLRACGANPVGAVLPKASSVARTSLSPSSVTRMESVMHHFREQGLIAWEVVIQRLPRHLRAS